MIQPLAPVVLSPHKALLLFGLGASAVFASDIGDPTLERYVTNGIGFAIASIMFYFYRQLSEQSIGRERENGRRYEEQTDKMIIVLQENSRIKTALVDATTNLNRSVMESNREQRERYENDLKERGRR